MVAAIDRVPPDMTPLADELAKRRLHSAAVAADTREPAAAATAEDAWRRLGDFFFTARTAGMGSNAIRVMFGDMMSNFEGRPKGYGRELLPRLVGH